MVHHFCCCYTTSIPLVKTTSTLPQYHIRYSRWVNYFMTLLYNIWKHMFIFIWIKLPNCRPEPSPIQIYLWWYCLFLILILPLYLPFPSKSPPSHWVNSFSLLISLIHIDLPLYPPEPPPLSIPQPISLPWCLFAEVYRTPPWASATSTSDPFLVLPIYFLL